MRQGNLGYMSRELWSKMPSNEQLWYLYDAAILRCSDCQADFDRKYEPKRGPIFHAASITLVVLSSMLGGFLAAILGYTHIIEALH